MTLYTAIKGSWKDGTARLIAESTSKRAVFTKSQNIANQSGEVVTIRSARGAHIEFTKVYPEACAVLTVYTVTFTDGRQVTLKAQSTDEAQKQAQKHGEVFMIAEAFRLR